MTAADPMADVQAMLAERQRSEERMEALVAAVRAAPARDVRLRCLEIAARLATDPEAAVGTVTVDDVLTLAEEFAQWVTTGKVS